MSNPVTPELSNTIVATLLPPDPGEALKQKISKLEAELYNVRSELWAAKHNPALNVCWEKVLISLVEDQRGRSYHSGYDEDALRERVQTLVQDDDDDVWSPERNFEFTLRMEVLIQGTVQGADEDTVRNFIENNLPTFKLTNVSADYDGIEISDEQLENLDIDEA